MATTDSATTGQAPHRLTPIRAVLPVLVVTFVAALLGVMYLDYVIDPEQNLHHFPIALVDQDVGDTLTISGHPQHVDFGAQVADGLRKAVPSDEIDLRVLGINEAQLQMQTAQVYGTVIIPGDFTKRLGILGTGSVLPGDIQQPIITLQTNPRAGAFATSVVQRFGARALSQVNTQVGQQLSEQVAQQLGSATAQLPGASRIVLAQPLNIVVTAFRPLPSGSGEGLTAFFYSLLLLMAGMLGAMIVHQLIDSALGFLPTEWGPRYVHYPAATISRVRTLLIKWAVVVLMALVVSGVYLGIGSALGMSIDKPFALYVYGVLVIVACGVTSTAILAALGSSGLIVNLILFIILGLPSSGGTIPIEATPRYFGWLATFEPMHQVFLGVRSLVYFNGSGAAGLTRGVWMAVLGVGVGLVIGLVSTRYYDRKGLARTPTTPRVATTG